MSQFYLNYSATFYTLLSFPTLQAFSVMEEMRRRVPNVNMAYYVNMKTIEATHKAVGAPLGRGMGAEREIRGELDEDEGEEVEEEVEEEMVNGHDDY